MRAFWDNIARLPLLSKFSLVYLIILVFLALFADFLADADGGLFVDFGPNSIGELNNIFREPGFDDVYKGSEQSHILGTDGRGRDVASIMIHGTRTSLVLGFLASLIAITLGSFLGTLAAYYGDRRIKVHPFVIFLLIISVPFIFYFSREASWDSSEGFAFSINWFLFYFLICILILGWMLKQLNSRLNTDSFLPIDNIVMRFAEIFRAVPMLFLLLSIISFFHSQNLWTTTIMLGFLGWSRTLRLVRGEILSIREETFVTNATLIGLSDFRIIVRHILPNILPILLVTFAFLISGFILTESTLSFLGLGLPLDQPSWGGLLRQSREDFGAWWLAIFPGLAITATLFSLNILAESYNNSVKKSV